MDRALYIAAGGASEALRSHLRETHNLANTNTTGFRADLAHAETVDLNGPGYRDRAFLSQKPEAVPNLTPGAIQTFMRGSLTGAATRSDAAALHGAAR